MIHFCRHLILIYIHVYIKTKNWKKEIPNIFTVFGSTHITLLSVCNEQNGTKIFNYWNFNTLA